MYKKIISLGMIASLMVSVSSRSLYTEGSVDTIMGKYIYNTYYVIFKWLILIHL